jgi:hypothetical protein
MKSVCLAILTYNGKKHLEHLLPTARAAGVVTPSVPGAEIWAGVPARRIRSVFPSPAKK